MNSQQLCEAAGGTYSTDPSTDRFGFPADLFVWSCNDTPAPFNGLAAALACFGDGGGLAD